MSETATTSALDALWSALYSILMPPFLQHHTRDPDASFGIFAIGNVERMAQTFVWYTVTGLAAYALTVMWFGKRGVARFTYALPIEEPGANASFLGGLKYMLPKSFFTHPSFKIDMLWMPFSWVLNFFGLLGVTLGAGAVQGWLVRQLGHSSLTIPDSGLVVAFQVVVVLVARDIGRFAWHYQGHVVPFFWEFHKGHHSAEVLHPFGVRTHPVDMFIRNTYTAVGAGLISGTVFYVLGMEYSLTAASFVATALAFLVLLEQFEHSHVSISFGKTLDRFFYAPYMHHFHHGALPQHMNVNLGITGGLTLWDYLVGTLYRPKQGEPIVWGSTMEELGENNPHRTLRGFFFGPFVAAFQTLRRRNRLTETASATGAVTG